MASHDHNGHRSTKCCCDVIGALAHAASLVCDQHCCCVKEGNNAGCACCAESMIHITAALDLHVKCLQGCEVVIQTKP